MRSDIKNHLDVVTTLAPASRTETADGTAVDLANHDAAAILITAGTAGGTSPSFGFEVQDSPNGSTWTAVPADLLDGTVPTITTANDEAAYLIGYHGAQRYVRVTIETAGGTTPTLPCSASVIRGHGRVKP